MVLSYRLFLSAVEIINSTIKLVEVNSRTVIENPIMVSAKLLKRYYPDNSRNGTTIFYDWLRSYTQPEFVAMNIGAGSTTDNKLRSFRGEVQKVVGVDVDHEVMNNKDVDEAFIIKNDLLPFDNNTFDFAWSDYVFEHLKKPEILLKEICRVLKPGASLFFRTPNKYHYVSLLASVTPDWFHRLIANRVRGLTLEDHEPYPTFHRLNTKKDILRYSALASFRNVELRFIEAEPSYLMFHTVPFILGVTYERIVNSSESLSGIRANIFGRLEK